MDTATENSLIRRALAQVLRQDISTSVLDTSLNYKISSGLSTIYDELYATLAQFSSASDFRNEKTNMQMAMMKYRMLLSRTLDEFLQTNEDINRLSPDQVVFMQNITVLGGKLQSYNQLLATAANHAKIYDKLREASMLSEMTDKDALDFLRRARESQNNDNPQRTDIKEIATTTRTFDSLVGLDSIVNGIRQTIVNIDIGLVRSFIFYIFYGIPGTGKTALAEAIATQFSNGEYYKFDQSFFASTYLGVTESRIRNILETVRSNPNKRYTIVIDEADNVLGVTPYQQHLNSVKILMQTEISSHQSFGPNLIIVCITNYLDRIDQTFKRRATDIKAIPPPSEKERLDFLQSQLTVMPDLTWSDEYRNEISKGFDAGFVYTNSDMGRLAKNVQDNFLVNLSAPNFVIIIEIFAVEKIVLFYPAVNSSAYRPVVMTQRGTVFQGTYFDAVAEMANYLRSLNTNLLDFRKYFAPHVDIMKTAIAKASTLTQTNAAQYMRV